MYPRGLICRTYFTEPALGEKYVQEHEDCQDGDAVWDGADVGDGVAAGQRSLYDFADDELGGDGANGQCEEGGDDRQLVRKKEYPGDGFEDTEATDGEALMRHGWRGPVAAGDGTTGDREGRG